jgi:hypothetical protein
MLNGKVELAGYSGKLLFLGMVLVMGGNIARADLSCGVKPGNPGLGILDKVFIMEGGDGAAFSCTIQGVALPPGTTPVDIFELNPSNPLKPVSDYVTITPVPATNTAVITVKSDLNETLLSPRSTSIAAIEPAEGTLGGIAKQTTPFAVNNGFLVNGTLYQFVSDPTLEHINEGRPGPKSGVAHSFNAVFPGHLTTEDFSGTGLGTNGPIPANLNPFVKACGQNIGYSVNFDSPSNTSTLSIFCTSGGAEDNADHPIPAENNPGSNEDHFQYSLPGAGTAEVGAAPGAIKEYWQSIANGDTNVTGGGFTGGANLGSCNDLSTFKYGVASYQTDIAGVITRHWSVTPVGNCSKSTFAVSNPTAFPMVVSDFSYGFYATPPDIANLNQSTDPVGCSPTIFEPHRTCLVGASGITVNPGAATSFGVAVPEPGRLYDLGALLLLIVVLTTLLSKRQQRRLAE